LPKIQITLKIQRKFPKIQKNSSKSKKTPPDAKKPFKIQNSFKHSPIFHKNPHKLKKLLVKTGAETKICGRKDEINRLFLFIYVVVLETPQLTGRISLSRLHRTF
jgi:hypothetical protein